MKHARWFGLAVVATLLVASAPASAQVQRLLTADIPFQFVAGRDTLPAGTYQVVLNSGNLLGLRGADGKQVGLTYVTRLASREGLATQTELIFDKVGDQNVLSEVWSTGQDGFLLAATKGPHTHVRVKSSK